MNLIAPRGKLIAERLSHEEQTPGGIWLADKVNEKSTKARVLLVGPPSIDKKGKEVPLCAEVGNIVHHKTWFGKTFTWKRRKLIALTNEDITGRETN